mgnify:FL=1
MNDETKEIILRIYEKIADKKRENADLWKSMKYIRDDPFGAMEEDVRILAWLRTEYPEAFVKEGDE